MCHTPGCETCFRKPPVEKAHAFGSCSGTALQEPAPANPKAAFGAAKPSLALVPGAAMVEMAGVFELGAKKYGPFNWRETKVEAMTYVNATLRHLLSWLDGEDTDPESSKSHLGHAMASLGIVIDAMHTNQLIDNRPTQGATARLIVTNTKSI
nr:dATP/dGTP diphosphohydrolase domain-containing protein [Novosphingobium umbonatum]